MLQRQHSHSRRFLRSSKRQPCPVCGRTKDGDCAWAEDTSVVFCHHPQKLIPDVDRKGDFLFVGNTSDDRASIWFKDQLRGGQ